MQHAGFFIEKIDFWLQNSKFAAKKFQMLKNQPFLIGINRFDSTHNEAVATARMRALRQPVCLNQCMIIRMINTFLLLLALRAELQRCNLQGVCGTFLLLLALTLADVQV